jgi:hypothetical protein
MRIGTLIALVAFAAIARATEAPKSDSSTEHSFDDLLVQGKYHFSDETVTTVEEDKVLDALIGVRTDFKDRLEQSAERY